MAKKPGISRVTVTHMQGGREVSSVTLTGKEFARATTLAPVESAVKAAMEGHNGRTRAGPHVVAREIAVVGQTVVDRHGSEYRVVTWSADRETLYVRGGVDNKLHTIRVSDGRAQCIER